MLPRVVYRSFPTSNHNSQAFLITFLPLYIVRFLHQTTTAATSLRGMISCISFVSYIKPQLHKSHPYSGVCCISFVSYIKPQPILCTGGFDKCCISFVSYIKPQRIWQTYSQASCCISFVSYIKPQLTVACQSL